MALGPIPQSAVKAYAEEFGIAGDELDRFWQIIRKVDAEYLQLVNPALKTKPEKGTSAQADDLDAVKNVMTRLSARASAAKRKH